MTNTMRIFILSAFIGIIFGCSNEKNSPKPEPPKPEEESLYAFDCRLFNPDGSLSYIVTASDLTNASQSVTDLSKYTEFGGTERIYGAPKKGIGYLTSSEKPTITEVTFDKNGKEKLGRKVSFAGEGITRGTSGGLPVVISETKAYYISRSPFQVIVWNPKEMKIIKTFPIGLTIGENIAFRYLLQRPIIVDNKLLIISMEADKEYIPTNGVDLSVINTDNDVVESNTNEKRGIHFENFVKDKTGNLYFIPGTNATVYHYLFPEKVQKPYILRILAGQTSFDPYWQRSLTDELGTQLWGGSIPGPDGSVYIVSLDDDLEAVKNAKTRRELEKAGIWDWSKMSDYNAKVEPFSTDIDASRIVNIFNLEGDHTYVQIYDTQTKQYTFYNTTKESKPIKGLSIPGVTHSMLQIK